MCGRYNLTSPEQLALEFEIAVLESDPGRPRFNIKPTQMAPVIFERDGRRVLAQLKWGLVPFWATDPKIGSRMINARAETVAEKPSYRQALLKRRCLVPANGFYEWVAVNGRKEPQHIRIGEGGLLAFAGLWESWRLKGTEDPPLRSFTIITTESNDLLRPIHDRMPVILPRDAYGVWLDPTITDREALASLLVPSSDLALTFAPVPGGKLESD